MMKVISEIELKSLIETLCDRQHNAGGKTL